MESILAGNQSVSKLVTLEQECIMKEFISGVSKASRGMVLLGSFWMVDAVALLNIILFLLLTEVECNLLFEQDPGGKRQNNN